jgi:hypothetical protein
MYFLGVVVVLEKVLAAALTGAALENEDADDVDAGSAMDLLIDDVVGAEALLPKPVGAAPLLRALEI